MEPNKLSEIQKLFEAPADRPFDLSFCLKLKKYKFNLIYFIH
jgi:hypothetical protein